MQTVLQISRQNAFVCQIKQQGGPKPPSTTHHRYNLINAEHLSQIVVELAYERWGYTPPPTILTTIAQVNQVSYDCITGQCNWCRYWNRIPVPILECLNFPTTSRRQLHPIPTLWTQLPVGARINAACTLGRTKLECPKPPKSSEIHEHQTWTTLDTFPSPTKRAVPPLGASVYGPRITTLLHEIEQLISPDGAIPDPINANT